MTVGMIGMDEACVTIRMMVGMVGMDETCVRSVRMTVGMIGMVGMVLPSTCPSFLRFRSDHLKIPIL